MLQHIGCQTSKNKIKESVQPATYSFPILMNRIREERQQNEPTISGLREELNNIKGERGSLKQILKL